MSKRKISNVDRSGFSLDPKTNGYFVHGKNNADLVRLQLDELKLNRYESLPRGGVKVNWITRLAQIDWQTFDSKFQILNHIQNEGQLSNKASLLNNLRNYEKHCLQTKSIVDRETYLPLKTFVPETYLLDNTMDRIHFKRCFEQGTTWICKPAALSCGRQVFVFQREEQMNDLLKEFYQNARNNPYSTVFYNRLVQKYIENPLLIDRRKFDIRTYLLCICTANDILFFAAQTGYLRLSMFEYDLNDLNQFIHLTNQTIQNKNQNFASVKDQTGMTMEEFNEYFNRSIQPQMPHIEKNWVINELPVRGERLSHSISRRRRWIDQFLEENHKNPASCIECSPASADQT